MSLTEMKLESNSKIRIDFGGGNLSSDGGLLLMIEFLAKIGFDHMSTAKFKTTDDAKDIHSDSDNQFEGRLTAAIKVVAERAMIASQIAVLVMIVRLFIEAPPSVEFTRIRVF